MMKVMGKQVHATSDLEENSVQRSRSLACSYKPCIVGHAARCIRSCTRDDKLLRRNSKSMVESCSYPIYVLLTCSGGQSLGYKGSSDGRCIIVELSTCRIDACCTSIPSCVSIQP